MHIMCICMRRGGRVEVEGGGGVGENTNKCTGMDDERKHIAIRTTKQQQQKQTKKK